MRFGILFGRVFIYRELYRSRRRSVSILGWWVFPRSGAGRGAHSAVAPKQHGQVNPMIFIGFIEIRSVGIVEQARLEQDRAVFPVGHQERVVGLLFQKSYNARLVRLV